MALLPAGGAPELVHLQPASMKMKDAAVLAGGMEGRELALDSESPFLGSP